MTQGVKPAPRGGAYERHGLGISDPVCEKEAGFAGDQRRGITDLVEEMAYVPSQPLTLPFLRRPMP